VEGALHAPLVLVLASQPLLQVRRADALGERREGRIDAGRGVLEPRCRRRRREYDAAVHWNSKRRWTEHSARDDPRPCGTSLRRVDGAVGPPPRVATAAAAGPNARIADNPRPAEGRWRADADAAVRPRAGEAQAVAVRPSFFWTYLFF